MDPSLSLAVCATNRNQLLALGLAGGKAVPVLAACKAAHTAGAAITKVGDSGVWRTAAAAATQGCHAEQALHLGSA